MPRFSIVIPSFLNSSGLRTCLESLKQHTDLEQCEIVIVANGAPPETRNVLQDLGLDGITLWFEKPIGFSKAVNAGIKESHCDLICLLNDDCVLLDQPKNHWLDLLSGPFSDPQVGITGSHKLWDNDTQHEFIIFFCAMLRRTMLDKVGVLDEDLSPFYGEDIDLTIRAERAGWKWVQVPVGEECKLVEVPDSEHLPEWKRHRWVGNFPVMHDAETTLSQLPNHVEVVERNKAKLRARYGPVNIARAEQIEGWMGHDELIWLATQARLHPIICEIGSWYGRSTRALADNLPEGGRLFAVDAWAANGDPAFESAKERDGDAAYLQFCGNLSDHILEGRVVPLRTSSANAAEFLKGIGVSMIFIDGDHHYDAIRADILNWQQVLVEGGLLCGHDYSSDYPGVVQAVNELLVSRVPDKTGIWEALDKPNITESVEGFGGFFCIEKQTNSLSA